MKTVTLVRHAKAEKPEAFPTDYVRPLAPRGHKDAFPRDPRGEQGGSQSVRVVPVHDVGFEAAYQAREAGHGSRREVSAKLQGAHADPGRGGARLQRPSAAGRHGDLVSQGPHALRRQQHLVLSASPGACTVHMNDPHRRHYPSCRRFWSAASQG